MRRRLDLAISLVGEPSVLYLDEPTTGLDPQSRHELWDVVRDLVGAGSTVLLTTQYLEEVDRLADDIVVMDGGAAIARGTSEELKAKTDRQTLELRPSDTARMEDSVRIVEGISGIRPHVDGNRLLIQINDRALPAAVLRRLDENDIELTELALRQPSLDEVFLSLTGHRRPSGATTSEDGLSPATEGPTDRGGE
jgi:oleandomycin transport system ATP-binding protein